MTRWAALMVRYWRWRVARAGRLIQRAEIKIAEWKGEKLVAEILRDKLRARSRRRREIGL